MKGLIEMMLYEDCCYEGRGLGFTYSKEETRFRVWAPMAEEVLLMLYLNGDAECSEIVAAYFMAEDVGGTWTVVVEGDCKGLFYTYRVTNNGISAEAADPYAKAAGVNGDRSAVVDLAKTNPDGWEQDTKPVMLQTQDAVIYELHIRDLAMDKQSGIRNKGKYLEFLEDGTKGPGGVTTGIDHLKELGVTHVHLLPVYDFASIDEKHPENNCFNWGYDPKNYNVPEGSYSTDPYQPETRIYEFKRMVQALHKNNIGVIFDAVFGHVFDAGTSLFQKIVPGYFFRMNEDGTYCNGSGCGNEMASERKMVRKYIVDSVKFWAEEYHIDGFRFDQMGLLDIQTMVEVKEALEKIDGSMILFGEGWDMGGLPEDIKAIQAFTPQMPGIGFYNDHIRDSIKGPFNVLEEHGFVDGKQGAELEIMKGVTGSIFYNGILKDYNSEPGQSINYAANHDNNTLWDKLSAANPDASVSELVRMHKLANAIVFTSQGVPYLHAGEEFLRTKGGDFNSYKAPDSVNALDWSRKAEYYEVYNYYKGLIELRKANPAFRLPDTDAIGNNLLFISSPKNTVAFIISFGQVNSWKNTLVIYNANKTAAAVEVPMAEWNTVADGSNAGTKPFKREKTGNVVIDPISALVACTNEDIEIQPTFVH